jgi:hypothetical protein
MRLIHFLEEISDTDTVMANLMNHQVDDRTDRERSEDEADNRVYPNPLPFLSPKDPRWLEWHDRGDEVVGEYMEQHGLEWRKGGAAEAKNVLGQLTTLPINKLISTERFLDPEGLQRQPDDKFSSPYPVIYKVDGTYLITDGNHRIVQAHMNGQTEVEVEVIDVDAYERRAA